MGSICMGVSRTVCCHSVDRAESPGLAAPIRETASRSAQAGSQSPCMGVSSVFRAPSNAVLYRRGLVCSGVPRCGLLGCHLGLAARNHYGNADSDVDSDAENRRADTPLRKTDVRDSRVL